MKRCVDCYHYNACKDWAIDCFGPDTKFPYESETDLCEHYSDTAPIKYIPSDCKTFIDGVKPEDDYFQILNWYRNLNYKEGSNTERGIMAMAINDLFMDLKARKAEEKFRRD